MKRAPINRRSTEHWKTDVRESVLFYNNWFLEFAPATFVQARNNAIEKVEAAFRETDSFNKLSAEVLLESPDSLAILRMSTTPPLARDRLAGLADVPKGIIKSLEEGKTPRNPEAIKQIIEIIDQTLDRDIMPWLVRKTSPKPEERVIACAIIGDRVCGALADPIIRNEQERRQFHSIDKFLTDRGYRLVQSKDFAECTSMPPGTFAHHFNIPAKIGHRKMVNIPVDIAIMRKDALPGDLPLLIECKSAGDFTNTNKRRKEEAVKAEQLKKTFGRDVEFILFLCGYFDSSYLGYEAAEGIDWIWEHRIADLEKAGV